MVFSLNGMYLATASEKGTMIRVHLVAQATKVKSHFSPLPDLSIQNGRIPAVLFKKFTFLLWNQFDIELSSYLFLHFYLNSHTVFGGEHIHQRSIRWHLVHLLTCLTFLLPQVRQALCTCFSLMLPGMEGTFPAFASYDLRAIISQAWFDLMILIFQETRKYIAQFSDSWISNWCFGPS